MTNTDLPAGYEDWEETQPTPPKGEHLRVEVRHLTPVAGSGYIGMPVGRDRYFVPPKPKPKLPDVRPGSVIRYTDRTGLNVRAIYRSAHVWDTYRQTAAPLNFACTVYTATDSYLIEDVNANGFLVELEGL
jgi:hypothetical protein